MSPANLAHVALHWSCLTHTKKSYLDSIKELIERLVRGQVPVTVLTADASHEAACTLTSLQLPDAVVRVDSGPHSWAFTERYVVLHSPSCSQAVQAALQPLACTTWPISPEQPPQQPAKHPKDVIRHIVQSWSQHPDIVIVGYVMKPSRERDLAAMGMFPIIPADGQQAKPTIFHPLELDAPLEPQQPFHVLLHKASDELVYAPDSLATPRFSPRIQHISTFLTDHPEVCIVDPLASTSRLIDRAEISAVLDTLPALPTLIPVRPPKSHITPSFTTPDLHAHLATASLHPPYIVKPLVACGVADSHQMALVLSDRALPSLSVPVPAVIQEYVNHGGLQYKVYVMGDHVTYTTRPSIPDIHLPGPEAAATAEISTLFHNFDSLKSLPKQLPASLATAAPASLRVDPAAHPAASTSETSAAAPPPLSATAAAAQGRGSPAAGVLDQGVLEVVAKQLREELQLTLFGFDVVVGGGSGEWLVIDVNYFPNYREVEEAPAHFQGALRAAYDAHCNRIAR